jgi:hypothetical protein
VSKVDCACSAADNNNPYLPCCSARFLDDLIGIAIPSVGEGLWDNIIYSDRTHFALALGNQWDFDLELTNVEVIPE